MEVQRGLAGASIKRLRYHGSALDVENLNEGEDFDKLPDVYIIFITETDAFGNGLPVHELVLCDKATGKFRDDGKHLIYFNGEYKGDDDLGKLMYDFNCKDADEMLIPEMAEGTRYLKDTKEGQNEMCDIMQNLVDSAVKETVDDNTVQLIENSHNNSRRSYDDIMDEMGLSEAAKKKYKVALTKKNKTSKEKEKVPVA